MTKFKVTYPLITTDGSRTFDTKAEAETFAREMRDRLENPRTQSLGYSTRNSANRVQVQEMGA